MTRKICHFIENITKNNEDIIPKNNEIPPDKQQPANFETAIDAAGYGLFHYILMIVGIPCCFSSVFSTTTMSFILPSAECDLKLTLMDKGTLNAVTYAGMISSAVMWGYLADTLGRKKLMIYGYFMDSTVVLCCSLSQSVWVLMLFKFLSGFIICGPFAVLMSYLTEFHGFKQRSRIIMATGILFTSATIVLPLLALAIIPQQWHITIGTILTIKSWQIFVAISCLPSLIAGTLISFMPESPKFLMSQGENEKALKVFRMIFKINTSKDISEYPIKVLMNENVETIQHKIKATKSTKEESLDRWNGLNSALLQITPLFKGPLLKNSILVFTIQFCILFGVNTMRLWLPVMFTMISEENVSINSTENTGFCSLIMASVNKSATNLISNTNNGTCESLVVSESVYIYTIYVGLVGLLVYAVSLSIANICGAKYILTVGLIISGSFGFLLYWATDSLMTFILTSLYVSITSNSSSALMSIVVNIFPTTLRTMTVSLVMMFGRIGSIIGNILFPYLLPYGCLPPFMMLGFILIFCSAVCTLLPKNMNTPLQ